MNAPSLPSSKTEALNTTEPESAKERGIGNQSGTYETPPETADFIVKSALKYVKAPQAVLDPAVGNGVFIEALIKNGIEPGLITAHDINEECLARLASLKINLKRIDSLVDNFPLYDLIVGNPPYKSRRQSNYMKANKEALERKYTAIGLYNLYALFIQNAINHLHEGGILGFIVEDSFCMNRYYRKFRDFILNSVLIREIILAPSDVFHVADADVRTAIIIFEKATGPVKYVQRNENKMRLVDRLTSQDQYSNPPSEQAWTQKRYLLMPDHKFVVGMPEKIFSLLTSSKKTFKDVSLGGTGISTGDDQRFLRKSSEVEGSGWVPFYKSGRRTPYYYTSEFSIHKDIDKSAAESDDFLIRNRTFLFKEGITCSSIGRHFSVSYMPPGCLFGVNGNFFFTERDDMFFYLGILNSKFFEYVARKFLNRSNILATSFIREFPILDFKPGDKAFVIDLVKNIIERLKENPAYDFSAEQALVDEKVFEMYGVDAALREAAIDFHEHIYDRI